MPLPLLDPAVFMRPSAARLLAFADRLDAAGDGALARLVRRATEGLDGPTPLPPPRGPLPVRAARWG